MSLPGKSCDCAIGFQKLLDYRKDKTCRGSSSSEKKSLFGSFFHAMIMATRILMKQMKCVLWVAYSVQ